MLRSLVLWIPIFLTSVLGAEVAAAATGERRSLEGVRLETKTAVLGRGDRLLLYTDGISEVRRFTGDIPQSDDITVLGLRFLGTGGG